MNKRCSTIQRAKNVGAGKVVSTGNKGPASTAPVHGKKNRWPYDASAKIRQRTR